MADKLHLGEILGAFLILKVRGKEQTKIEYSLPSLVAMAYERTIAAFFIAQNNQPEMEVYHETI